MRRMRLTQGWFGRDRLDADRVHPPRHPCVMPVGPWAPSPCGQPPYALIRCPRVWFVQYPPHMEMLCTLSRGSRVETRPRPPHQGALSGHTHGGMIRREQRPLARREQGQLFFSPRPTPPCVARFVGITALGMPPGRARVLPVVPSKSPASPFAGGVSHGQSGSDAPHTSWLMH